MYHLRFRLFGLLLSLGALLPAVVYAAAPEIRFLHHSPDTVEHYGRVTATFELDRAYTNPYDPDILDASVVFHAQDGIERVLPAFWNDPPQGAARWEARLCADRLGITTFRVRVRDEEGLTVSDPRTFETVPGDHPGFVRVDPRNPRYLRYDDGTPYLPVGHNVCWGSAHDYRNMYPRMKNAGENWSRVWMESYVGQGIEWRSGVADFQGVGRYSQLYSEHFDIIFDLARENGLYVQLAMDSFNSWNYNTYANWGDNPYFTGNGGWLETPDLYFTDPQAFEAAKKRHRYIIARWAYNPHVLAWEFFNEVDITYRFHEQVPEVLDWHRRQARYIQALDPYDHLITTSFSNDHAPGVRFPSFWEAPEMDIVQVHRYNDNLPGAHVSLIRDAQRFGKPVILGEFGREGVPNRPKPLPPKVKHFKVTYDDPTGRNLHNGIWGAALAESGGMSWWWGEWIHPWNLYPVFTPLARYLEGEDWAEYDLEQTGFSNPTARDVEIYGLRGPARGYAWVRARESGVLRDLTLELSGVRNESYFAEYWNTYDGEILQRVFEVASNNNLQLEVPDFERDIALKIYPVAQEPTPTPTISPTPYPTLTPTATITPRPGDFTGNGSIGIHDLFYFAEHWQADATGTRAIFDLRPDGAINAADLLDFIGLHGGENETDFGS